MKKRRGPLALGILVSFHLCFFLCPAICSYALVLLSGDIGFGSLLSGHLKRVEKFLHVGWIAAGGWQDYQLVPASFYEVCSGRRNSSRSLNQDFFTGVLSK